MADAAAMRAKIARGVEDNNQGVSTVYQVMDQWESTAQLWATVTDKPEMVAAIQTLQNARVRLEEALTLVASANTQAESYASRL